MSKPPEFIDDLAQVAANKYYYANRGNHFVELAKIDGATVFVPYDIGMAAVDTYFSDPRITTTPEGVSSTQADAIYFDAQATIEAIKRGARKYAQIIYDGELDQEEAKRQLLADSLTSWEVFV